MGARDAVGAALAGAPAKTDEATARPSGAGSIVALRRRAETHIISGPELAAHLAAKGKQAAYQRMLTEFGIDATVATKPADRRPTLIFAEQPGCWYTARDLARARLRRELTARFGFDAATSGLHSLGTDGLTGDGDKALFLQFSLFAGLGPAQVIGAALQRRYHQTNFDSVPIAAALHVRLATIWGYSIHMLQAAERSPQAFADEVARLHDHRLDQSLRVILPRAAGRPRWERLAETLRQHDLAAARATLQLARNAVREARPWTEYWDEVNAHFLGETVSALGPRLADYLLSVAEPVQMARHLIACREQDPFRPVSVAGFVDEQAVYRIVLFDPRTDSFFVERDGGRASIDWQYLRVRATGGAARPSGTLLYLLLAASGHYLIADPGDELQAFQRLALSAHRRATGLKFPWLTFDMGDGLARAGERNTFLDAYSPDFEQRATAMIARFVGPS